MSRPARNGILSLVLATWVLMPTVAMPCPPTALAQGLPGVAGMGEFLDQAVAEIMDRHQVPGLILALVSTTGDLHLGGYGTADAGRNLAADPHKTPFLVGSVGKVVTATAVLTARDAGLLGLDRDINTYLDTFQVPPAAEGGLTLVHLLTHTAGFDERSFGLARRSPDGSPSLAQHVSERLPPRVLPPGEIISYSNYGFALAGLILEEVSGTRFSQYVRDSVLLPLGMETTSFDPRDLPGTLARGHAISRGVPQSLGRDHILIPPAGSLWTTASDMSRFMLAQLGDGNLSQGLVEDMHAQRFTHHPLLPGFTLGIFELYRSGERILFHGGGYPGFTSMMMLFPDRGMGLFFSYNLSGDAPSRELVEAFLARYLPQPEVPPLKAHPDGDAGRYQGAYRPVRHARLTAEKLLVLGAEIRVRATDHGHLLVAAPGGREAGRWVKVEPLLFRHEEEERYLAFSEDEHGRVARMYDGILAYDRLAWYESVGFQMGLLVLSLVTAVSALVLWPVEWFCRRRRPTTAGCTGPDRLDSLARPLAAAVGSLNLVFTLGAAALLSAGSHQFLYGPPAAFLALSVLPHLSTISVPVLCFLAVRIWTLRRWTPVARFHYCLVVSGALAFALFALYWNLIGFRF